MFQAFIFLLYTDATFNHYEQQYIGYIASDIFNFLYRRYVLNLNIYFHLFPCKSPSTFYDVALKSFILKSLLIFFKALLSLRPSPVIEQLL